MPILHDSAALNTTRTKSRRVIRRLTDNSSLRCSKMAGSRSDRDKFPRRYFQGGLYCSMGATAFFQSNIHEPEYGQSRGSFTSPFLTGLLKMYHATAL